MLPLKSIQKSAKKHRMTEYMLLHPKDRRRDRTPSSHTIDVQSVTDGVSRRVKKIWLHQFDIYRSWCQDKRSLLL